MSKFDIVEKRGWLQGRFRQNLKSVDKPTGLLCRNRRVGENSQRSNLGVKR
jgi:hypothetical protein